MRNRSVYVKPTLKKNHRMWYEVLWSAWWVLSGIVVLSVLKVLSFVLDTSYYSSNYDPYYNYSSPALSTGEVILTCLGFGAVILTAIGFVLLAIGGSRIEKTEKYFLSLQEVPMDKKQLHALFDGLIFQRPTDSSSTYTVVMKDPKNDIDYWVKITGSLYLELKEFHDKEAYGFVLGENFK